MSLRGETSAHFLLDKTNDAIIFRSINSSPQNIGPLVGASYEINVPEIEGYKAVIGFYASNNLDRAIIPFSTSAIIANNELTLGVYNAANKSVSNVFIRVNVLYVKEKKYE